jgi:hypothetical protein
MFHLTTTLCENGGTPDVMVKSKDTFVPRVVPHLVLEANHLKVTKVQPKCWHMAMAKLHDLAAWPTIDQITNVILGVMVVHDEEKMLLLKGTSPHQYQPHRVLFDFGA